MIFLKPAEVFALVECLRSRTNDVISEGKIGQLNWHFTTTKQLYNRCLVNYIELSMKKTSYRSVFKHCKSIGFDYTHFIDNCLHNFFSDYVPLSSQIDLMLNYLLHGVKALYKMAHAITM